MNFVKRHWKKILIGIFIYFIVVTFMNIRHRENQPTKYSEYNEAFYDIFNPDNEYRKTKEFQNAYKNLHGVYYDDDWVDLIFFKRRSYE